MEEKREYEYVQKGVFVFSSLKLLQKLLYKTSTAAAVCSSHTDTIQLLADQTNKKRERRSSFWSRPAGWIAGCCEPQWKRNASTLNWGLSIEMIAQESGLITSCTESMGRWKTKPNKDACEVLSVPELQNSFVWKHLVSEKDVKPLQF